MKCRLLAILLFPVICLPLSGQSTLSEKRNQADAMLATYEERMQEEKFTDAKDIVEEVLVLEREIQDTTRLISVYLKATRSAALSGDFSTAIDYGREGSHLSQLVSDIESEFKINNLLSWSYFETEYDFEKTFEHEKRQVYLADQLDIERYKAGVYNNYGYDGTVAGTVPLEELLEFQHQANNYYARENGHEGLWYTLMNLTWIYRLMGDLSSSERYGRLSSIQARRDNDWHAISEANTNLAETYLQMGRIDLADSLYLEALQWEGDKPERDRYVFDVYYGRYLWEVKNQDQGISRLEQAVEYLESGEVFYEMLGRLHLAAIYVDLGKTDDAKGQLAKIRKPRHNYISFEVRALAEKLADQLGMENELPEFLQQANEIGAHSIVKRINEK